MGGVGLNREPSRAGTIDGGGDPRVDSTRTLQIGLYVHVPFCVSKCDYCDFFSVAGLDSTVYDRVIAETLGELEEALITLGDPIVGSLYIGGGTPSALGDDRLARLVRLIIARITSPRGQPIEVTVEANPRHLSPALIQALWQAGVNRLSVGVQSFDSRLRSVVGRRGPDNLSTRLGVLRDWPGRLSFDLIQCIPGQDARSAVTDVEAALNSAPVDHLSVYSLSVDPDTPLARRLPVTDSSSEVAADISLATTAALERYDFHQYEVSNFSRPGCESAHNLGYWFGRPYLGIGPGAVSTLPARDGSPLRLAMPASIERYLRSKRSAAEIEYLTPENLLLERFMLGLRTRFGVAVDRLSVELGIDGGFLDDPRVARRVSGGELRVQRGRLTAYPVGVLCLDAILADIAWALDDLRPYFATPWREWFIEDCRRSDPSSPLTNMLRGCRSPHFPGS